MKILLLDIETSPNLAYVWGLFKQNVGINQIESSGQVLCWAAKWLGEKKVFFSSLENRSPVAMLQQIHNLVDEADAVVHYNGVKFDMSTLNRDWIKNGFAPPSPVKHIDLLHLCKRQFRFASNKLDYVGQYLELGEKVKHSGFDLWTGCMRNDPVAWAQMREYNIQDVLLLEKLYYKLRPWHDRHPSVSASEEVSGCPKCGSLEYERRGYALTVNQKYQRYQCKGCGGWFRGHKSVLTGRKGERFLNVAA